MDRRQFLNLSAVSLLVTACADDSKSKSSPLTNSTPPVTSNISNSQWQSLANNLSGDLILPNDSAYQNARLVFNTRFDHVYPQAIVRCASEQDIIDTINFIKEHDLTVTPRCGGHGYAGYSTTEGLVIDVTPLDSIIVKNSTVTIGAGARLVDVYDQLTNLGVCIPIGSCLSVGVSGLTLGGGVGVVDRAYGLTCDNLLSADVVTASGEMLTCSENEHQDLFWAIKGGGGGNFGVVSSFTFKTHPTTNISVFEATYHFDNFVEVMMLWQTLSQNWPNDMWCQVIPDWTSGTPSIYIRAFCLNSVNEAKFYWDDFHTSISVEPTQNKHTTDSYRNIMMGNCSDTVAACHLSTQFENGRMQRSAFAASSDFFNQLLPEQAYETLKIFIENSVNNNDFGMIIINTMGGAIDDFSPTDTAFWHRNTLFSAEYYAPLRNSVTNVEIDQTQAWQNSFREVMAPWSTGGAYVNYIDPLIENWQHAYYGDNYLQLQQVKLTYDPDRVFNMPQGVEPA